MKQVVRVGWFRYELPLRNPVPFYGQRLHVLRGFLLRVEDQEGHVGWGEAPLGMTNEQTFSGDVARLRAALPLPVEPLGPLPPVLAAPPVRMAWTGALLDLEQRACGPIRVNALLEGSDGQVLEQATLRADEGYTALKLKVGGRAWADDAKLVAEVRRRVGAEVQLRVDANRAWSLPEASAFCSRIEGQEVEYVEEPLASPADLPELARATAVTLALDETLQAAPPEVLPLDHVGALVVKPALELGRFDLRGRVEGWRKAGKTVTLSSCFESGVGLTALARLADRLGLADTAHGLDTHRYLAHDLLDPPFDTAGGVVRPSASASLVNLDLLEELP